MTLPDPGALSAAMEATWPPADARREGPWTIRDGRGGGKRVSAATAEGPVGPEEIEDAEAAMRSLGQVPLFMIRDGEEALDAVLSGRGYALIDPVVFYAAPIAPLAATKPPPVSAFTIWEPLAIMADLWAEGGIGPGRLNVMHRMTGPKTALFGRSQDQPAGVGFAAIHEGIAMVHALEVAPRFRRAGVGRNLMHLAARWGVAQGARHVALAVTRANAPANRLYSSLGMEVVGSYHYRMIRDRSPHDDA